MGLSWYTKNIFIYFFLLSLLLLNVEPSNGFSICTLYVTSSDIVQCSGKKGWNLMQMFVSFVPQVVWEFLWNCTQSTNGWKKNTFSKNCWYTVSLWMGILSFESSESRVNGLKSTRDTTSMWLEIIRIKLDTNILWINIKSSTPNVKSIHLINRARKLDGVNLSDNFLAQLFQPVIMLATEETEADYKY